MKQNQTTVAIIGRPNVGKSTLFNRLLKERKSIVDDVPGVTRDRLYSDFNWNNKNLTLIDTGGLVSGIDQKSKIKDEITNEIRKQVLVATEDADFIIFLVDGTAGITSQDEKIASNLRKIKDKKKIFLTVNKIDTEKQLNLINEFYSLGLGEPYPISALSGSSGLADILDEIASHSKTIKEDTQSMIRIAILGKPNVGKSSILNCLVGKERSIVTPIAGTTRDCIDAKVTIDKDSFMLIDTAGLRRKSKVSTNIERYATTRSINAIERADIVLLIIDSTEGISDQDQKIASVIKKRNKGSIILANKWDLIKDKTSTTINRYQENILSKLHFINYSQILMTSALEKKNIHKIWGLAKEVFANYQKRISTGKLNKAMEDIILTTSPPTKKGKQLKIYYTTQANIEPPEIVLFVNDSEMISPQYEKFLEKEIRSRFDFSGSPIKLVFRNKRKTN